MKAVIAFFLTLCPVFAQADLATLTGVVTDQADAVVPGVTVTARNVETNFVRTMKTTPSGDFALTNLPPGTYELTAEMEGFRVRRQTGIVLEIGETLRADMQMQVGAVTDSVTVTAEATPINTERGAVKGDVIVHREIQDLPLEGRDFVELAYLTPGVVPMAQGGNGSSLTTGGARSDNTNFYVDGFSNRDSRRGLANSRPNIDAVQEFKMETSGYSAEFGRQAGGALQIALRSGANRPHGAFFEYLRNNFFDARSFFDPEKLRLRRNQYGATFSGPVFLPKVYNGRDRTFFLVSWESYRQVIGESRLGRVPTLAERAGYFSNSRTSQGAAVALRDPFASGNAVFPNNRIPASLFNPIALKLMQYYPAPNRADAANNYVATAQDIDDWDSILTKIDHRFSSRDSASFRFQKRFARPSNPFAGSDLGTFGNTQHADDSLMGADYTHMFSPALLIEARGGFSRTSTRQNSTWTGQDIATQLGITGTTHDPELIGFPRFSVMDYLPLGTAAAQPAQFHVTDIQANAKMTWVRAKHLMKWGFDVSRLRENEPNNGNARGTFVFQDRWTNYSAGDFLLGLLNGSSRLLTPTRTYLRAANLGAFFNDDYRVSRSLTLNLGLRYEFNAPPSDLYGRMSNYVPELNKVVIADGRALPDLAQRLAQANLTGRVVLAGDAGLPSSLGYANRTSFAPRFGFAWRPFGAERTVLRGGYGIFYAGNRLQPFRGDLMTGYPFAVNQSFTRLASNPNLVTLSNPFPAERTQLSGTTDTVGYPLRPPAGYLQNYSLTAERELGHGMVFEAAYVGSKGTHLGRRYDINQPYRSLDLYAAGIPFQRPISGFNTINYYSFGSNSVYNSGQFTLRRRSSGGFFYRINYTYGKSIDDSSQSSGAGDGGFTGAQDSRNLRSERGRSDWDRGHIFTAAFATPLPIGRGRTLLKEARGAAGFFVNGWQLTGTVTMYTGPALTVQSSGTDANLGESVRPNRLGTGAQDELPGKRGVDYPFFRITDFERTPRCDTSGRCQPSPHGFLPFAFGNSGRNILDGPGSNSANFGLMKDFRVRENRVQFRYEVFNAFNRAHFRLPNRNFNAVGGGFINSVQDSGRGGPRVMQFALKYEF